MPENTEQKREVSEIDVSGFERSQNVIAPTISQPDPDPETDLRFQFVRAVKQFQPKYAYTSNSWILTQLRENSSFRSTLEQDIINNRLENDNEFRNQWNSDEPETEDFREEYRRGVRQQIIESTTREAVKGETAKQSIVTQHFNLSKKLPKYDVANPLGVVSSLPGEFSDWFDEKKIKNNQVTEESVRAMYDSDDDFRKEVIKVQVQNFEKALTNKANQGVFDPSWSNESASEYAKAYAIFNRFGSEALTDYTNILQHYIDDPNVVQDSRVIGAFRRFRDSPQYRNEDIFQYASDFLGGRKVLKLDGNEDIAPYARMIQEAADKHQVDPALLAGLITQESIVAGKITGVDPAFITSSAGARGLVQLMPDTARGHGLIVNGEVDERTNPIKSINAGARELSQLLNKYEGDEKLTLAAYNAGQGTVDKARARAEEEGESANWQKYMREFQNESNFEQTANYIPKVQEYRNGYSTTTVDQLEFKTREPITPRERDWNGYTNLTYYTPQNDRAQIARQKLANFIEANYMLQTGSEEPVGIFEMIMDDTIMATDKPVDLLKTFDVLQGEMKDRGVKHFPDYANFGYDIVQKAISGDSPYTFDDLVGTVAANAIDHEVNDAGEISYILDYRELNDPGNQHLRMIVDGLNMHSMGDNVLTITGNKVKVEPHKQARRDRAMAQRWLFNSEKRPIIDEGRTLVGFEEHVPNNFSNTAAGVVVGATNILPEAWGGIVGGWGGKLNEVVGGNENLAEFFDNQRHKSRDFYSGTLSQFTDPVWEPGGMPFSATDLGVAGGTLLGYLGGINFLGKGAILGVAKLGKLAKGGAHGTTSMFSSVSAIRKAQNFREFYSLARGSMSRAARDFRATANAVSKKYPYGTWPKFVTGSAAIETFTDPNYSLATLVNSAMPNSVNQLAANGDWNLDRTYRTSGHMARWGMDFVAGEMLGLLFDGLIGVSKLANDHTFRALRGKPKLGLEYDPSTGKYRPESESKYYTESSGSVTGARKYIFPEIQRFVYNIRNNADNIPIGDIRKAAGDYATIRGVGPQNLEGKPDHAKITIVEADFTDEGGRKVTREVQGIVKSQERDGELFEWIELDPEMHPNEAGRRVHFRTGGKIDSGIENIEMLGPKTTQADIAAKFVADSNDFMHTIREDIQGIIRDASDTYGGRAKLSEDDILKLTDEVYDEFMDGVARQTYSFIGEDKGWNIDTFSRQLEDHPGDLADITPLEFAGETTLTRKQAQVAHMRNPNAHVVPVGDGTYKVYESDPALWRHDLSRRLRQYGQQPDTGEGNLNRHLERFGLDAAEDGDLDDIYRVIDTLETAQGVGFRVGGREGVISGFTNRGWQVRWDDGSEKLYGSIRGLDEVPETPPDIKMRKADTTESSQRNIVSYDEEGKPIYEDVGLRGSQQETEDVLPTLDVRSLSRRIDDEIAAREVGATREEVDALFPDAGTQLNRLKTQLKEAMAEGRHDEADDIIREISTLRRTETGQNDEAIPLPGVVKLEEIVKRDRAEFEAARAYSEPDDVERIRGFHEERLTNSLRSKDEENILTDIQMLRGMGMSSDEMDELINENVVAGESLRNYYRNYNRSLDFGEGVTDDLIAARVDARRAQLIEDEAWNKLPEKVQQQMIDQADLLANTKGTDEPQRLIDSGDAEVTAPRSWETSNERVRDVRPPEEGMSPKEYATQLAEDLGTGTVRDIAKLQKTRSGGSEKVPIRTMSSEDIVGPNGEIKPIKNSKGLVVRVDPVDGGLPYYAIGRKNNIKGFPTRFVPDQNGTIIYNQEWAFINPNVTQRADGQLKRFNPVELPNGEVVYRQHEYGKFVLNVQNPIRVGKGEYLGQTLKGTDGSNMVIPGKRTEQILTPDAVFRRQVDAIEIIDPASSRIMYRVTSPESQVLRHGKEAATPGDQRSSSILFESNDEPLNAGEVLGRMSKEDESKVYSHAWLAIPGMIATGGLGIDENGELTTPAKVAMAMGVLGIGGVLIRSMRGNFKLKNAYNGLDATHKQAFDKMDWLTKVDRDGTPIRGKLTDEESAMFNRLQGVPKDDYRMLRDIMDDYEEMGISRTGVERASDEIPEITAEMRRFRSESFSTYGTSFDEDGVIRSSGATEPDEIIALDIDMLDFVHGGRIGHEFIEQDPGRVIHTPIAWARVKTVPDGKLLVDELQVDNALQKGQHGISGDVTRDLYSAVLDDVVDRAIKESGGEFYITRGHMQASRYGEDPDTLALRGTANRRVAQRVTELREETPEVIIRDAETIENARKILEFKERLTTENFDEYNTLVREFTDPRTELRRVIDTYRPYIDATEEPPTIKVLESVSDLERGELRSPMLSWKPVTDGYRLRLSDTELESRAIKEIYESTELAKRSFPRQSEFERFLKQGSQTGGLLKFYDDTLPNIIRKRYGAEVVDAMGEPRDVYGSPSEAFHRFIVTEEGLRNARNKTGKRINWELVGGSMGAVGLAAAAYNMEDIGRNPERNSEVEQAGLGFGSAVLLGTIALGMFGRGRMRTKVGANIKGKVNSKLANVVDKTNGKAIEIDGHRMSNRELYELNSHFNPRDQESVTRMEKVIRGAKGAINAGKDVGDWFKNSAYTQAGIQHLRKVSDAIKTKTGFRGRLVSDDIANFLQDAHNAPAKLQAITDKHFNETLGHGPGAFKSFQKTKGVQAVNNILAEASPDDEALLLFNGAVTRLLNRGAHRSGERVVFKSETPPHVRQVYESENGEVLQRLDEGLLNDPEVMDFVETLRKGYGDVRKQYLDLLINAMGRRIVRFRDTPGLTASQYQVGDVIFSPDDLIRLTENWVRSREILTFREYSKTLNPDERHLLRIAKRNSDTFDDILQVQNMRRRFTDLEGRYSPQMVDFEKVSALRDRYRAQAERDPEVLEGTGAVNADEYATLKMKEDFRALNKVGDGRGLVGFDETTLDLKNQEFGSIEDARIKLENIITNGSTDRIQDEWSNLLGGRTLTNELAEELGFVVRGRNQAGETVYHLRQPEGLEFSESIFDIANSLRFDEYYNTIMLDPAIRKSNFLENPRKFHLPMGWMMEDPMQVWKKYSIDTGTRLHALEYGIFDAGDFSQNLIEPLQRTMKRNGFTSDQVSRTVSRVEEMHATQFGIMRELMGKTPNDATVTMNNIRKTNAALQTYRNLDYMKRTYGFKYLDWFQNAVTTLAMTSWSAFKASKGFGENALSATGNKQLGQMFMDLNVIKEKDLSFRFDIQTGDPTGEHGSMYGWAQKNSQRLADKVSDFSLEKSALKLFGVDVGSSGRVMRMFTSSFHDVNIMNTVDNGWAFMVKAQEVARIARQMQLQNIAPDGVYRSSDGAQYNWEMIYRQLEDVGVSRYKEMTTKGPDGQTVRTNEADYFIQKEGELTAFMDRMKNNHRVSMNDFDGKHADIVENMWHFATESYHGTNRVMRPEKWNTQLGRTLSMYASFTFNAAMQVTRRRMLDPVDTWISRYGFDADGNQQVGKMQLPRLLKAIRTGDEDALRAAGITDPARAIAEFPLDAIDTMRRGMAGIGFGIAGFTTLDIMRDIYAYPVQVVIGVPDEDKFRRTRQLMGGIINPYDTKENQVTLADLYGGEADVEDMARVIAWSIGKLGQSSYGGMYLSPFESVSKYGFRGVTSLAPSLGIADRFAADIVALGKPWATANFDEVPGETAKFMINNLPVIGSNVFSESRWSMKEKIDEYQKRLDEEETGF